MSPDKRVGAEAPLVGIHVVQVLLEFVAADLPFLGLVFRPLELVLGNAVPEILVGGLTVPGLDTVLAGIQRKCRTEGECVTHKFHLYLGAGSRLEGKVFFAEAVDTGGRTVVPAHVIKTFHLLDGHVVHLHPALGKAHMESDVVQTVTFLVSKENHGIGLPFVGKQERGTFLLTVVRRAALHNGVDGHVTLGLEGKRIVGGIGKPLGRLQLQAPTRVRKLGHRDLHAFAAIYAKAFLAQLALVLGRAIGVVPDIPATVAIGQVAVVQHILGQGKSRQGANRHTHILEGLKHNFVPCVCLQYKKFS